MNKMKSVLINIKKAIEKIEWKSETYKEKALYLCISIYNLYVYNGGDFHQYRELSYEYFKKIIKTNSYIYDIKNSLLDNNILEVYLNNENKEAYNKLKNKAKSYRFNQELIDGEYDLFINECYPKNEDVILNYHQNLFINNISNINYSFNNSINYSFNNSINYIFNNYKLYHICSPKMERIQDAFFRLKFRPEVNEFINNYKIKKEDILINEYIDDEFINIKLENDEWRVSIEKALKLSKEQGKDLILYKEYGYIENLDDFINRKEREMKLIFKKNIFEVDNNIFRISRNETNGRLDYNLTNMKSDLLNYLELDGEKLNELDIANAQFSLLSYLIKDLDEEFIYKSQNGTLYNNDKKKWFRIAFDKIKKDQDEYREIYPKTMKFIDTYKRKYGYKSLSNLLQNLESLIMIDGLLPILLKKYDVFPIHDAIRVKESQVNIIKEEIENYFKKIGLKCLLRNKLK